MKNKYSMQKMFSIFCALILLVSCFSVFSACQPKHTCQSVCQDCGKCTNANCVEKACAIKCAGHHICESLCPSCNKCTDTDCVEKVCVDKCAGHHSCTSQCEKCGKCQNLACTERVCAYKCVGHHVCEDPCPICGKCVHYTTDPEYKYNKCKGHETCLSICPRCGKCFEKKCNFPNQHIRCECDYLWEFYDHMCANVCNTCGLCTNKSCTQEPCSVAQCDGHDVPLELTLANEPVIEWVYTELTPEEEEMILQGLNEPQMGEYYGRIGDKYFHCPIIGVLGSVYDYSLEGIYLIGNAAFPIFMYYNGENIEIDKAYEAGLLTKDEIVILSHYLIAYRYRVACIKNGIEITEPIKVNVIAHLHGSAILYFIGEKPDVSSTMTPRIIQTLNLDCTTTSAQYGTVEFPLLIFGDNKDLFTDIAQKLYDLEQTTWVAWVINEYFNLYLESIY